MMALTWVQEAFTRFFKRLNGLHWSLILIYILNGVLEAFPMTAFQAWLQQDIGMSPSAQSTFYATIFIPWSLKPLYAWLSEKLPIRGRRRKPYIIISSLLSAATYLMVAYLVNTQTGALGITMLRTASNACTELIADLATLDYIGQDASNAGHIQAAVTALRAVASIIALLLGMPMYPCTRDGTPTVSYRTVLAASAAFPLATCLCAFFLPERQLSKHKDTVNKRKTQLNPAQIAAASLSSPISNEEGRHEDVGNIQGSTHQDLAHQDYDEQEDSQEIQETQPLLLGNQATSTQEQEEEEEYDVLEEVEQEEKTSSRQGRAQRHGNSCGRSCAESFPVFQLTIPAVLLLVTWSALKDLMTRTHWLYLLAGVLGFNVLVAGLVGWALTQRPSAPLFRGLQGIWPALVLFIVYATPSSATQITSWYYSIWATRPCYPQTINIMSSISRVCASGIFFTSFATAHGRRLVLISVFASIIAAALQLLYIPLVDGTFTTHAFPRLGYAIACTLLTGIAGQVAMIAFLTVATRACPDPIKEKGGLIYAILLSLLDFGDSVSGWITAPIASALHITFTNYSGLDKLVYIDAGTSIAAVPFMLLLLFSRTTMRRRPRRSPSAIIHATS
eukprot:m.51116 g.51116  ORF g.51116 m.51116 type:complete len:619 (-) comp12594_c0_seq2:255-2111(-)